jgi:hypothetical protein
MAADTIITWADTSVGSDMAVSFQESQGANFVWCAPLLPQNKLHTLRTQVSDFRSSPPLVLQGAPPISSSYKTEADARTACWRRRRPWRRLRLNVRLADERLPLR